MLVIVFNLIDHLIPAQCRLIVHPDIRLVNNLISRLSHRETYSCSQMEWFIHSEIWSKYNSLSNDILIYKYNIYIIIVFLKQKMHQLLTTIHETLRTRLSVYKNSKCQYSKFPIDNSLQISKIYPETKNKICKYLWKIYKWIHFDYQK